MALQVKNHGRTKGRRTEGGQTFNPRTLCQTDDRAKYFFLHTDTWPNRHWANGHLTELTFGGVDIFFVIFGKVFLVGLGLKNIKTLKHLLPQFVNTIQ